MSNTLKRTAVSMILPFTILVIWGILALKIDNSIILPKISQVFTNFLHATKNYIGLGSLPKNILVSLMRVLFGYVLGVIVALPLGILMGY